MGIQLGCSLDNRKGRAPMCAEGREESDSCFDGSTKKNADKEKEEKWLQN